MSTRQPIWEAYADADMTTRCPNCGAQPNIFCTNTITGRVRRTPCIARIPTTATTEVPA